MDAILRGAAIYIGLMIILRFSGRRTMGEMTTFDFVLLLIIAETTQQALLGDDYSITNALLLITTLVAFDILLSYLKTHYHAIDRILDGLPMVLVENGRVLQERLNKSRIDEGDVLSAARRLQGLERIDQIKYAVLEANGHISIVPKER
ncbi:MAG TPA: YetF domain-containing protein [Xanthobacteraceae bacterium]|nr:YetF domain-containing protein [Xanthobacteraceae bacterium]